MTIRIVFDDDPSIPSYGFFRCGACGSELYAGGPAIHSGKCLVKGYDRVVN